MNENRIIVFSCTYNAAEFINKCILSVKKQNYTNFKHVLIDDATKDRTADIIKNHSHDKLFVERNSKNMRWICNAVTYLDKYIEDEEDIIFVLDGDDWMPHPDTLSYINKIYNEKHSWFTYGMHCFAHGHVAPYHRSDYYTLEERQGKKYRDIDWRCYHPRTFKAFLWKNLDKNCLKLEDGTWPPYTYDKMLFFPLLEMCPPDKIEYIDKILYVYNKANGQASNKQKHMNKGGLGGYIRSQPKQETLIR